MVPGTDSGQPAASTALRAMFKLCSPTCITQPITTSSIMAGSMLLRVVSAVSISAARSTGCQFFNRPLRLPSGVRTASTMTAVCIKTPFGGVLSIAELRAESASGRLIPQSHHTGSARQRRWCDDQTSECDVRHEPERQWPIPRFQGRAHDE